MKRGFFVMLIVAIFVCLLNGCKSDSQLSAKTSTTGKTDGENTVSPDTTVKSATTTATQHTITTTATSSEYDEILNARQAEYEQLKSEGVLDYFAEDASYWYGCEGYHRIYKKSKTAGTITVLLEKDYLQPSKSFLTEGWIYYLVSNERGYSTYREATLFKMDTNGKQQTQLLTPEQLNAAIMDEQNIRGSFVYENKVYLQLGLYGIYYYNADNNTVTDLKIWERDGSKIEGEYFYCSDFYSVYRLNMKTMATETLLKGEGDYKRLGYRDIIFLDGELYYYKCEKVSDDRFTSELYAYQSGNPKLLADDVEPGAFEWKRKIYYSKKVGNEIVHLEYDPSTGAIGEMTR